MMTNQEYFQKLKKVECPDASFLSEYPLVLKSGQGSLLKDVEGRTYLDMCAGFGVMALGHAHPEIRAVFSDYASSSALIHGMGDVYPTQEKVELLTALLDWAPAGFTHAALAISGGQAVELAVKTAALKTQAAGFIAFQTGYHGLDLGILSFTGRQDFKTPFAPVLKSEHIRHLPFQDALPNIEKEILSLKNNKGFAGIVVEPMQGRGGVLPAEPDWLRGLYQLCKKHNGLLIYDEVFTGFGRTGRSFMAAEFECDLLCVGKALGGGMPLSACLGKKDNLGAWPESQGEALHTGTFFGHPLSCAVALKTLEILKRDELVERARITGTWFKNALREELQKLSCVKDIRGQGLMVGVEFEQSGAGVEVATSLQKNGVLALPSGERGHVLSLTPALNIEKEFLETFLAKLKEVCNDCRLA